MKIEFTNSPKPEDIKFLTTKINEETSDIGSAESFGLFIRDKDGEIIAGLNGYLVYGAVYTDLLWVHKNHRKQNLARNLIQRAEEFGRSNGCLMATVSTTTFQAPEFYKKLGYKIDFQRRGYVNGASVIFMSKDL